MKFPSTACLLGAFFLAASSAFTAARADSYTDEANSLDPVFLYGFQGNLNNSATGTNAISDSLSQNTWTPDYVNGPQGASYPGFENDNEAASGFSATNYPQLNGSTTGQHDFYEATNKAPALTLSGWVDLSSTVTGTQSLMVGLVGGSGVSGFQLNLTASGVNLEGRSVSGDTIQSANFAYTFSLGTWYDVVGILNYANDTLSVYVDGTEVGSPYSVTGWTDSTYTATAPTAGNGADEVNIGSGGTNLGFTAGSLDNASVYNYALSATQIADLYAASAAPEPSTGALLLLSLGGLAFIWRRKRLGGKA